MKVNKQIGFTLIELLIAVAIVGILLSVAYPSYRDSVEQSERAVAKAALASLGGAMERYYAENNTYVGATLTTVAHPANVPLDGGKVTYQLSIVSSSLSASAYTLNATPKGTNTIIYSLSSTGEKKSGKAANNLTSGWSD